MRTSESINEIAAALAKAQGEMEHASKDSKNPHFKSTFANLTSVIDACRNSLSKNSICYTQVTKQTEGVWILITRLIHASGQWIESDVPILTTNAGPQGFGSGLTYARRYGLQAITGVTAEDDDANHAQASYQGQMNRSPAVNPRPQPVIKKVETIPVMEINPSEFIFEGKRFDKIPLREVPLDDLKQYFDELSAVREKVEENPKALHMYKTMQAYLVSIGFPCDGKSPLKESQAIFGKTH